MEVPVRVANEKEILVIEYVPPQHIEELGDERLGAQFRQAGAGDETALRGQALGHRSSAEARQQTAGGKQGGEESFHGNGPYKWGFNFNTPWDRGRLQGFSRF